MGRMMAMTNLQLRVQCNSTRMRDKIEAGELPLTERLLQPYWDVFIIFYPPMELLDGHWKKLLRLPAGEDFSDVSNQGYSIKDAAFNRHRDHRLLPHHPCLVLTDVEAAELIRMAAWRTRTLQKMPTASLSREPCARQ
jgi:hypothetical protein